MKVSHKFKEFRKGRELLVVAGSLSAKILKVDNGNLTEDQLIAVPKAHYTDKPGVFRSNGKGTSDRTGEVNDINNVHEQRIFFRMLANRLKHLNFPYEKLYLFGPQELLSLIKEYMPRQALSRLSSEVKGNFLKMHPNELLKRVEAGGGGPELVLRPAVRRIMHNAEKAGHIGPKRRVS